MKQTPYRQNTKCLGLFSLAWLSSSFNKKTQYYQKYGLTSYLASCSTSLSARKTYLATTGCLRYPVGDLGYPTNKLSIQGGWGAVSHTSLINLPSQLLVATSLWTAQDQEKISSEITSSSYVWPEILSNGLGLNKGDSFSYVQKTNDSVDETSISNGVNPLTAFKISRDYVSGDSSEGFEDWSFLDQKRPYDSLVRENIFELLEDLERSGAANNSRSTIHESDTKHVAFEEHLFSSEINKTYTNRLRLEQRIKQFYGLSNLSTNDSNQKKGSTSSYDTLLQLEKRIDVQLFRLNWVSSIAHARQILKHKHIGIIHCKDRMKRQISHINAVANVAASNLILKVGDLLYWREKDIFENFVSERFAFESVKHKTFFGSNNVTLNPNRESSLHNSHKFPWFGSIDSGENKVTGSINTNPSNPETKIVPVFALASEHGSISLSNDIAMFFTHMDTTDNLAKSMKKSDCSLLKISKYFETHYKYSYAIRTSQDFKLEYLRLPQSSIQKNEWKAFLESSI